METTVRESDSGEREKAYLSAEGSKRVQLSLILRRVPGEGILIIH